jgi:hypothetical protein
MPQTIRFHLDENVDPAIAQGLVLRGVDVTTTQDAGLISAEDVDHLEYCRRTGRVLFTTDRDFLRIHSKDPRHPGIVYAHQRRVYIGDVVRGLLLIWEWLDSEDMIGTVEYI